MKIRVPKGMVYKVIDKKIWFSFFGERNGKVVITKIDPSKMSKEYWIGYFKERNYDLLEVENIIINNYPGFTISFVVGKTTAIKGYNKATYIIPENLYIRYIGEKKNYKKYKKFVDGIGTCQ
jgi:hypothetical protein